MSRAASVPAAAPTASGSPAAASEMTQVAAEDAVRAALGACIATLDAVEHEAAWRLPATLEHASNTGWIGLGSAGLMLQVTGADITRTLICLGARTALDAYRAALTTLGGAT